MAKQCPVCGEKMAIKTQIKDGEICSSCTWLSPNHKLESIETVKGYWNINQTRHSLFSKTSMLKGFMSESISIDDKNKLFFQGKDNTKIIPRYYSYEEVSEYRFEQVGGKVVTKSKGGIGRAIVGGALFGGAGAVVGASTSKKETKTVGASNILRISLHTYSGKQEMIFSNPPAGLIPFLDKCIDDGQDSPPITISAADEIIKFKNLLDQGIITQEEFNAKKKQLLDI